MKLLMHVLDRSNKLGIDNNRLTMQDLIKKLEEETSEVRDACENKNSIIEVARETLDVIQMCIAILDKAHGKGVDLLKINIEHKDKIISEREWIPKTGIEINILE